MDSIEILTTALKYEIKIRDLYREADSIVDDERGKAIFRALADDEQGHVDFLEYSIAQLKANDTVDPEKLQTNIPTKTDIEANIEKMRAKIPEQMLGDIKTVLNSALQMEIETSSFYRDARDKSEGEIREILERFLEIEENHVDVVQIELDHAMNSGFWFNFMEVSLEVE